MIQHGMVIFKIYGKIVLAPVEHWKMRGSEYFHPQILPQTSDLMVRVLSGCHYGSVIKNRHGALGIMPDPMSIIDKDFYILLRNDRSGLPMSVLHEQFQSNRYCMYHKLLPYSTDLVSPKMLPDFVYSVSI